MSYTTYTTDALVCGTWSRNTADRSYLFFTREAGMLYAEARSAREERSKQRFALQDFSLVRVSLIKGKNSWKVGSIESKRNYFMNAESKEARGSVVSTVRFLRRFFSGEQAVPVLFDYVVEALTLLVQESEQREFIEKSVQVHILLDLGYVDGGVVPDFIQAGSLQNIEEKYAPDVLLALDTLILKAVSTSHL